MSVQRVVSLAALCAMLLPVTTPGGYDCEGYSFFPAGSESGLIRSASRAAIEEATAQAWTNQ